MKQMDKRGQAVTLGRAPQLILILALTVMIAGASALAVQSFQKSTCDNAGYYSDDLGCWNNASRNFRQGDYAVNATTNGLTGLDNFSGQVPTIGTVLGVALIVVVVVGAFAFFIGGRQGGL